MSSSLPAAFDPLRDSGIKRQAVAPRMAVLRQTVLLDDEEQPGNTVTRTNSTFPTDVDISDAALEVQDLPTVPQLEESQPGAFANKPGNADATRRHKIRHFSVADGGRPEKLSSLPPMVLQQSLKEMSPSIQFGLDPEEIKEKEEVPAVEALPVQEVEISGVARPVDRNDLDSISSTPKRLSESKGQRSNSRMTVLLCCLLLIVGAVVVGVVLGIQSKSTSNPTSRLGLMTESPTMAPTALQIDGLPNYTTQTIMLDTERTSPQARAYEWVLNDPNLGDYSTSRILQRFALAVFYYATNGVHWNNGNSVELADPIKIGARPGRGDLPLTLFLELYAPTIALPVNVTTGPVAEHVGPWLDYAIHECEWYNGNAHNYHLETCTYEGIYVNLFLTNNILNGTLPPELALLSDVKHVVLGRNYISGSIPSQVFRPNGWQDLQVLVLDGNFISGVLPTEIGLLSNSLELLRISENTLTGPWIPSELFHLSKLSQFDVHSNRFHGTIPTKIATSFPALTRLDVHDNTMVGTVPSEIGLMTALSVLDVGENRISGTIPTELGNSLNLVSLRMESNAMFGRLPSELGFLKLKVLDISKTDISGSIPREVAALPFNTTAANYMRFLNLVQSAITGIVPPTFCPVDFLNFDCSATLCGCNCSCTMP